MTTPRVICPYCDQPAELVKGREVYPRLPKVAESLYWACKNGHELAYVGTHPNGKPLGRLANRELRQAKARAVSSFSMLWKTNQMSRRAAVRWMRSALGMTAAQAHIGLFDVEQCDALVAACRARTQKASPAGSAG